MKIFGYWFYLTAKTHKNVLLSPVSQRSPATVRRMHCRGQRVQMGKMTHTFGQFLLKDIHWVALGCTHTQNVTEIIV